MKRLIPGLHQAAPQEPELPDGCFLVQVARARLRAHPQKPFIALDFVLLQPEQFASREVSARLYCTSKALWKLNWFLHDFGYDSDLLERDELDEKAMVGLRGVVKVSHARLNGRSSLNLDGFAGAQSWSQVECDAEKGRLAS